MHILNAGDDGVEQDVLLNDGHTHAPQQRGEHLEPLYHYRPFLVVHYHADELRDYFLQHVRQYWGGGGCGFRGGSGGQDSSGGRGCGCRGGSDGRDSSDNVKGGSGSQYSSGSVRGGSGGQDNSDNRGGSCRSGSSRSGRLPLVVGKCVNL